MLKNLGLALCFMSLLAGYSFAQNGHANAADVHVFVLYGPDSTAGPCTIAEFTSSGTLVNSRLSQDSNPNWGIHHGMTVSPNGKIAIGVSGKGSDFGFYTNSLTWNGGPLNSPDNFTGYIMSFSGIYPGGLWATTLDWEVLGADPNYPWLAYCWGRWNGPYAVLQRFSQSGWFGMSTLATAYSAAVIVDNVAEIPTGTLWSADIQPWATCRIWGNNIYLTRGYNKSGVIFRIPKNFADNSSFTAITSHNDFRLIGTALEGTTDWYGICFDEDGYMYLSYNNLSPSNFNNPYQAVAKFKLTAGGDIDSLVDDVYIDLAGFGPVRDMEYGAGKFFICNGNTVKVYDKSGTFLYDFGNLGNITRAISLVPYTSSGTTFTGTVNLLGWMGTSLPSVTVTVDGTPSTNTLARIDADTGTFTVSLPATGPHSIKVKAAKTLSQTKSGSTPAFIAAIFNLQCGDNTNDNVIDDFDFNAIITNFGSGAGGDGNGDGTTDDFDFNLVITNFGGAGS
jgi:hypothetical protein